MLTSEILHENETRDLHEAAAKARAHVLAQRCDSLLHKAGGVNRIDVIRDETSDAILYSYFEGRASAMLRARALAAEAEKATAAQLARKRRQVVVLVWAVAGLSVMLGAALVRLFLMG